MALISCSECGKQVSDKAISCPNCGAPPTITILKEELPPQSKPSDLNQHSGRETSYYSDDNGIRVTSVRFIVPGTVYPLQGITGINTHYEPPNRLIPILFIVMGGILLLLTYNSGSGIQYAGWLFCVIGIIWLFLQKTQYIIRITTSAGSTDAINSTDEDYIAGIARALNEAIIHRG